ncbi:hypothetical protein N7466_001956 [Penicillium verhagenii]|uniref:uncharacterized protein n=1 Tax=Penicillium verhagenii TaxID=1562060 RepID=UPI0025452D6D|nr:uncharacterized protein N7466_001956 [Penicillium verhagenii]KAJ5938822.1 hypothetical protein N7466_001956 [Penicillium verhagenii]
MVFLWPWHFVTVSEEEKLHRRELLDVRGAFAQWSILIVIVILRVIYQTWKTPSQTEKKAKASRGPVSWWDRPLVAGWLETRRQYALCFLWLSWLFGLCVWNSGDDYLHLTKALGHVGLSQVPLQILMSPAAYISTSKPSAASIFSFITNVPQGTLTPYHRLFGRVVISPLIFGHATLYLLFFVQNSHPEFGTLLAKRVRDLDVQCGLLALSTAIVLLLFARPRGTAQKGASRVRATVVAGSMQDRRRYFYLVHVSLVVVLCGAAYFHVAQAQRYMAQSLGAFVLNAVGSWVAVQWGGQA